MPVFDSEIMKKWPFLILTLLCITLGFAQEKVLKVEYSYFFKNYFPEQMSFSLIADEDECISSRVRTIMLRKSGEAIARPSTFYNHFYRTRDSIYYIEKIGNKPFYIVESLDQFEWTLTGKSKTILGYRCQEASTTFRGRNLSAFFTTELPFKAAPWKFHGLPGTILEISSVDNHIVIEATELEVAAKELDLENPIEQNGETYKWDEFVVLKKRSFEDFKNKAISQGSAFGSNTSGQIRVSPEQRIDIIIQE